MNKRLGFYLVEESYSKYLRQFDQNVRISYGNKKTRPYVGVLLEVNHHLYFAPLSSPKPKHQKMKNSVDFIKINRGNWGVINLNNMIPVVKDCLIPIEDISFQSEDSYINLLANQLDWCNANRELLQKRAKRLYSIIVNQNAGEQLKRRCCDFKLLEKMGEIGQKTDYREYTDKEISEINHSRNTGRE